MKKLIWLLDIMFLMSCDNNKEITNSTVNASVVAFTPAGLSLPPLLTLVVNQSAQLTFMLNGNAIAGNKVSWSSSDTSVAQISSTGLITATGENPNLWPRETASAIIIGSYKSITAPVAVIVRWPNVRNAVTTLSNCAPPRECTVTFDFDVFADTNNTAPFPNYVASWWINGLANNVITDGNGHAHIVIQLTLDSAQEVTPRFCSTVSADILPVPNLDGQAQNLLFGLPCWTSGPFSFPTH